MAMRRTKVAIGAAVLAATASFIAPWEGFRPKAYQDVVGVWTICYGHIEGVKSGQVKTAAECKKLLADDLPRYAGYVEKCIHVPLTDGQKIALISLVYNVGPGAVCSKNSSVARNINAGRYRQGCEAIKLYNRAGGKVWRGLTLRREDEFRSCMEGI